MAPYLWLFLKIFVSLLVFGLVEFFVGWIMRARDIVHRITGLEEDAQLARRASNQAGGEIERLRGEKEDLEKEFVASKKSTVAKKEFDAQKAQLAKVEKMAEELRGERDSAMHALDGVRETSASGAEFSEMRRELEARDSQLRKLKSEVARAEGQLRALQPREAHDLVGFEDERDGQLVELRMENARLREILSKVQAGDHGSVLELADQARAAEARGAAGAADEVSLAELEKLRGENVRLQGELEAAKKKVLASRASGGGVTVDAGGKGLALERERDQLMVELAKTRAGAGGEEETLRAEVARLRGERDRLAQQLVGGEG